MQLLDPGDSRPRLKVEALIGKFVPGNVIETVALELQGTFQMSIDRSSGDATHEHTGPRLIRANHNFRLLVTRDLCVDLLYTLGVTDDVGATSVNDGFLDTNDSPSVDRNTVEEDLPETLQYIGVL
jgi:hypothetical protein